jgi:beta-galactosidase
MKNIAKRTLVAMAILSGLIAFTAMGAPREKLSINPVWRFKAGDPADAGKAVYDDSDWDLVSLPHTHRIIASTLRNYEEEGRIVGWYRRDIDISEKALKGKVFIVFQGAMQSTKLWVNGKEVGEYAVSGYDSFHFDITAFLKPGKNKLAVRVDNTEQPTLPPDGEKRDFVLFGGLYRDVDLVFTGNQYVTFPWESAKAGIRLTLPEVSGKSAIVQVETSLRNDESKEVACVVATRILDKDGKEVASMSRDVTLPANGGTTIIDKSDAIQNPELWSPDNPYLYTVETTVRNGATPVDLVTTRLGIRWVEWNTEKGFFLNGKHLKLVGANRHQAYPFIGYALPNSLHRRDAQQMKDMGLNWVRLSHYPHDPDFLDYLDELGIMALAEAPTWMKIPNKEWVVNMDKSFRSMIRRDRNHPSIIIWNACVNHQKKHPVLVQAATEEDPTRARGQDTVPCPMDFSHKKLSGNAALCIEHTGHTFNTFRGQGGNRIREYQQAKRHWEHTDAAYKKVDNSGLAVWCLYDYNTPHYGQPWYSAPHGVFDLFRIPKVSYWWHCSELGAKPITYGLPLAPEQVCIFSNAEKVRLSESTDGKIFNDVAVLTPDEGYQLKHPPFHSDVTKGTTAYKAEGLVGGKVVSSHVFYREEKPATLEMGVDSDTITADGADITRVFVKLVDRNGTVIVGNNANIEFSIEGEGRLVGENPTALRAGEFIILVQSTFTPGNIKITANLPQMHEIAPASILLKTTAVASGAMDMPSVKGLKPSGATQIDMTIDRTNELAKEKGLSWFKLNDVLNAKRGEYVESDSLMVVTDKPGVQMTVKGCEYRVYSSEWSTKPVVLKHGDAVFLRMKAPEQENKEVQARVRIDGVTQIWKVRTSK